MWQLKGNRAKLIVMYGYEKVESVGQYCLLFTIPNFFFLLLLDNNIYIYIWCTKCPVYMWMATDRQKSWTIEKSIDIQKFTLEHHRKCRFWPRGLSPFVRSQTFFSFSLEFARVNAKMSGSDSCTLYPTPYLKNSYFCPSVDIF